MSEEDKQNEPAQNQQADNKQDPPAEAKTGGLDGILSKLDEDGRKAVRAEMERARGDAAKYRTKANAFGDIDPERAKTALAKLDELEQQGKSDAQKASEAQQKAEEERDSARKELWREKAGRKHQLTDTFISMLQGNSQEEMDEHAKKIAEELGEIRKRPADSVPSTPKPTQSPGSTASDGFDPEKIAAQALAR